MWKKRKEIEGVSMGPMIALKASVFGNKIIIAFYEYSKISSLFFADSGLLFHFFCFSLALAERQFVEKQIKASGEKKPKVLL